MAASAAPLPPLYKAFDNAQICAVFFPLIIWASNYCPLCEARLQFDQILPLQQGERVRCASCGQRITWKTGTLWEGTHATPAKAAAFLYASHFGLDPERTAEAAGISVDTARNWAERLRALG